MLEAWINYRGGIEGLKAWASPSCFRGFSVTMHGPIKVLFKKVKSRRKTDRRRGPRGGINLNFRLS